MALHSQHPGEGWPSRNELGHNMGLLHDRYQATTETEESIEGWHYGYVNQRAFEPGAPESARWRTIMSYAVQCEEILGEEAYCPRLAYFSNPRLTYNGDPMGVSANNPSTGVDGPADAVRTAQRKARNNGELSSFRFLHTEGWPRAVELLAVREWGHHHCYRDIAQTVE